MVRGFYAQIVDALRIANCTLKRKQAGIDRRF
ncbi:MAG: hypothetical protein JWR51_1190 [Devosia sp.]|nr:hypothetical protein [Devosia sp.]